MSKKKTLLDLTALRLRVVTLLDAFDNDSFPQLPKGKTIHVPHGLEELVRTIIEDVKNFRAVEATKTRTFEMTTNKFDKVSDYVIPCLRAAGIRVKDEHDDDMNVLGSGHFGDVLKIKLPPPDAKRNNKHKREDAASTSRAVKVVQLSSNAWYWLNFEDTFKNWHQEVVHATNAGHMGVGPRVYEAFVCNQDSQQRTGFMIMDMIKGSKLVQWRTNNKDKEEVKKANEMAIKKIERLHSAGIFHGDLHAGNVIVVPQDRDANKVKDVFIVDYGFTNDVMQLRDHDIHDLETLVDGRHPAQGANIKQGRIASMLVHEGSVIG
jgi:tRNA A-37 threonylcarbamoyl transferase component Bud32